jgi:hypothetical protein
MRWRWLPTLIAPLAFAAAQTAPPQPAPSIWTPSIERVFSDDPRMGSVQIETAWAKTSGQYGTLRYKVTVTPRSLPQEHNSKARISRFLDRMAICEFRLNLADSEGFQVTTLPLQFVPRMDDDGQSVDAEANSEISLSVADYQRFWGSTEDSRHGMWSLGKSCPVHSRQ